MASLRDIRREIGQLVIVGFNGYTLPADVRSLAREFDLGGVIVFARNVEAPEQVAELSLQARGLAREIPLWVSVDQEGGRVARLKRPFTEWPPMMTLGRSGNEDLARRFAKALAAELNAVGISLDYTPVLDIFTNPKNTVIGDRAFGDNADVVARIGRVIVTTLQDEGIAACGKHFPGHGDTLADSHDELPIVEQPPDRLRAVEFVPFRAALEAGVAMIMTAHVLVPAFDDEKPASLSARLLTDVLREELRCEAVILTDDLTMHAVADRYTIEECAVGAIAAGSDAMLICSPNQEQQAAALEALIRAAEDDRGFAKRIEHALARNLRVKERFLATPLPPPRPDRVRATLGRDEHQAIAQEMARFL
jgi:beta-N-acetylhexosaminidase